MRGNAFITGGDRDEIVESAFDLMDAGWNVWSSQDTALLEKDLRSELEWIAATVMRADTVIVLPRWESFPSAKVLTDFAAALGKPILTLSEALATAAA